jgi:transcriptional regulator with XRE-family HTH domain
MAITKVFNFSIPITNVKNLGDRIRETREELGLTQAELARACGVSQGTIGNLESGIRKSARQQLAIAAALNVDLGWLLSGKGQKDPLSGQARVAMEPSASYNVDPQTKEALRIFQNLSPKAKIAALEYLNFLATKAKATPPSAVAKRSAISAPHTKAA